MTVTVALSLCSDVKQLELELSKVESGLELTQMEAINKENLASLASKQLAAASCLIKVVWA